MEDPRIISALFIFLKMAYYNVLINSIADVYNCIASCQLSYYTCLHSYCIMSAFVLQMSTTVLHSVSFRITSCLHLYYIMSAFVRQNPIFPSKLPLSVRNSPTGELARYA